MRLDLTCSNLRFGTNCGNKSNEGKYMQAFNMDYERPINHVSRHRFG